MIAEGFWRKVLATTDRSTGSRRARDRGWSRAEGQLEIGSRPTPIRMTLSSVSLAV